MTGKQGKTHPFERKKAKTLAKKYQLVLKKVKHTTVQIDEGNRQKWWWLGWYPIRCRRWYFTLYGTSLPLCKIQFLQLIQLSYFERIKEERYKKSTSLNLCLVIKQPVLIDHYIYFAAKLHPPIHAIVPFLRIRLQLIGQV